jgi:polar amino acid transport system substrate-binding protein
MEELDGKRVAVVKGSYQEEYLRLYYPNITIISADNLLEAMRLVMQKEADATIEYHSVNQYNISRYFFTDLQSVVLKEDKHFTSSKQYIGMRNDMPLLKSIIDKTMQSLSVKEVHELREKWLDGMQEKHIQLNPDELRYLKNKKSVSFCADPNWLPVEKIEGKHHVGIAADLLGEISKKLNLRFTLVPTASWEESLNFVQTKQCDFLSSVVQTAKREKFLNFSSSYLKMPLVITTQSDTFFVHSLKNLKDKKIGVVRNYTYTDILRRDNPNVQLTFVANAYEGLKAVDEGTIYAYVDTLEATSEQLRTSSFSDLKISGRLEEEISLSFGVRKDDFTLFDILEKGLSTITPDQRKEIYNKWVYVTIEEGIDYALVWKFLFGLTLLALFFMYRYKLTLNYNNQLLNINKELEKLNVQLEELSQTDQLTQVSNRRHLDTTLSSEIKRARRYNSKLCVLLLDIDYFKKVNDNFGHPKGDEILKGVAKILNENSRQIDTVGRWGGEEFLIILSQVDLQHSVSMAEKLRELIKAHDFGLGYPVTASFGVTEFDIGHDDEYSLLSRVDSNLYEAKEQGRDMIIAN